ncbi:MAG: hypothetical protein H6Q86_1970 [candidate division NC10 bacterium]|nr:hypothetical protein [candidate division NC10 bacterium]
MAGFVMLRAAFRPVGPVMDLTVGGNALFFSANASGTAADGRQGLTPKGGRQHGHAR